MSDVIMWRPRPAARPILSAGRGAGGPVSLCDPELAVAVEAFEAVVRNMTDAGLSPMQISIGLAQHLNRQLGLAMPTADAAEACKALLLTVR